MPASAIRDEVQTQVRALTSEVGLQTAQLVALAMVEGAALAFLEITDAGRREAILKLLTAITLDMPGALTALAN